METYYTTKQVQDLLRVDRITVYRMLQDGRLRGVKIGNQWRFPQREVERTLNGVELVEESKTDTTFPIHCVQTIQNLFASVSQSHALVVDMEGEPVTQDSRPAAFCQMIQRSPSGRAACLASWRSFAAQQNKQPAGYTCHAGLRYFGCGITNRNKMQGLFLSGQLQEPETETGRSEERIRQLAREHQLDEQDLQEALQEVPVLTKEKEAQLCQHPSAAAEAVESILKERSAFLDRLQQIANLTQSL